MHVRMAQPQDFADILALYRQLHPDDPVIEDGRDTHVFAEILDSAYFHLFVAEEQGRIVATCYVNLIPNLTRNAAPYAILENVVTDKAHRNRGIGKTIVPHADMLRTFNMGVGIAAVVRAEFAPSAIAHLAEAGVETYEIGEIVEGSKKVKFINALQWS